MREIKFRAWGGEDRKYFVYFSLLGRSNDESVISDRIDFTGGRLLHDHANIDDVQQFTGLKDKNGKEIYEGDIVRGDSERLMEVKWFSSPIAACWDLSHISGAGEAPGSRMWNGLEVIGNIWENPELISKKV